MQWLFYKKSELNLDIFTDNFATLKECYSDYIIQEDSKIKEYIKDSCVKRFEYTYETKRNDTSHEYSQPKSNAIVEIIPSFI